MLYSVVDVFNKSIWYNNGEMLGVKRMSGKLLIAGGNLNKSKKEIHKLFIEYAGGINSKLAIVPTASGKEPISTIKNVQTLWIELGISPKNIVELPIYGEEGKEWREPALGDDDEIFKMLDGVNGFWFTGGNQYYTYKAFVRKDGSDTKILTEMKNKYENGAVIGGTSAGAAIMSEIMIASGSSLTAINLPILYKYEDYDDRAGSRDDNVRLVKGLGFFKGGIIDQHFDRRPRILRLIRAITDSKRNYYIGYGVSEDTAMIYDMNTKLITVVGSSAIYTVNCNNIKKPREKEARSFKDVVLNVIREGDQYNTIDNTITFLE